MTRYSALRAYSPHFYRWALLPLILWCIPAQPEPIPVRYLAGSLHGFLALRTLEGKLLAAGDLTQIIHGNQVISHLVFHFKDGSLDDETAVFSQAGTFRLISDHHIQKGPIFPHPMNVLVRAHTGEVTVRYRDHGQEKIETERLDLPDDVANGIILDVLLNLRPDVKETLISYVATTPKPRLVRMSITPDGEEPFSVAGEGYKGTRFKIKVNLGGITGIIAPFIGKQPADTRVWVVEGDAPVFVRSEGPLYEGGPVWSIETTSPVWRREPRPLP